MWNVRLNETQFGIKIARRNINNFRYADAAADAAKLLQSCPTLWDPIDGSPPGSPIPGILQDSPGKSTGVGCHCLLQYADDINLITENKEELNSFLMEVKAGLKLNIQKMKIMASSPITLWQIDGETMETVADFIFLGSKITADDDCSHEIKRCLCLGRKAMTD